MIRSFYQVNYEFFICIIKIFLFCLKMENCVSLEIKFLMTQVTFVKFQVSSKCRSISITEKRDSKLQSIQGANCVIGISEKLSPVNNI